MERGIITLKPNDYRRLKTATSERVLTIFPQLGEILRAYKEGPNAPTGRLFFPSLIDPDRMIGDMRKSFDRLPVPERLRFPSPGDGVPGALPPMRSKWLRHTYCAARLQCTDHDRPISPYTVACEMGHASTAMVQRVYAHLGQFRMRGELVEYR